MSTQNQSGFQLGLPGLEHLTLVGFLRLFGRRKWLLILSTLLVGTLAALAGYFIPNKYRATTVIMVDPRKVPDNFVAPTVASSIADRLATLRQRILSSTNLTEVMDQMKLYPELRERRTNEELVTMMSKNIDILVSPPSGDRGEGTFKISYQSTSPEESAAVTNKLASRFIEENVKARESEVQGTSQFIDQELAEAKQDLQQKEEKIRQIKSQYISDLPESQAIHVQAISSLQLDLRSEEDAISRAQQQKVYYQSQLLAQPQVVNLDGNNDLSGLVPLQTQLAKAQTELDSLRSRYGQDHPDVVKKTAEVKELERRLREAKDENSGHQVKTAASKPHNPVLESQIAAIDEEIKSRNKHEADIKEKIAYHQSKLERIPVLEQQLAAVNRDYENARDHYKLLMDRKFSADMSTSLESFQKSERFIVLDPAQVPSRPFSPDRRLIDGGGLAAGLLLGLFLAVMLETFDPTVKSAQEILGIVAGPVLAEVPVLTTKQDLRKARFKNLLGAAASTAAALVFALVVFLAH
ncbi:MAG TPA: XrtA system polysaccharide chain length determinant [Candidatus Angelobacter sp.]|jgi:polysaccharide chain length determinant protein (PEP-CTERM system associated)